MTHKPLNKTFSLKTHNYEQIEREGDIAIFKQSHKDNASKFRYEVVRVGRHNGYTIAGIHIEPAESYPGATQWGLNGFTCLTMEAAEKRFNKMMLLEVEIQNEIEQAEATGEPIERKRETKRIEIAINIPVGKFSAKQFAASCKCDLSIGSLRLRQCVERGEIKFVEEKRVALRGKLTKFYQKA